MSAGMIEAPEMMIVEVVDGCSDGGSSDTNRNTFFKCHERIPIGIYLNMFNAAI